MIFFKNKSEYLYLEDLFWLPCKNPLEVYYSATASYCGHFSRKDNWRSTEWIAGGKPSQFQWTSKQKKKWVSHWFLNIKCPLPLYCWYLDYKIAHMFIRNDFGALIKPSLNCNKNNLIRWLWAAAIQDIKNLMYILITIKKPS